MPGTKFDEIKVDSQLAEKFFAAAGGEIAKVEKILADGFDVNSKEEATGETLLMKCAGKFNHKMVEFLCEKKADVNLQDKKGKTALHHVLVALENMPKSLSIRMEAVFTLEILFLHKADRFIEDNGGSTAYVVGITQGIKEWNLASSSIAFFDKFRSSALEKPEAMKELSV